MPPDGAPLVEVIEIARQEGAKAAEALLVDEQGFSIEVQRGRVIFHEPTRTQQMSVRCWDDRGAEGSASGAPASASALVRKALALAGLCVPDPASGPIVRLSPPPGGLSIEDRRHVLLTPEDRVDVALAAEKAARASDRRIRTEGFRYSDKRVRRMLVSTRGLVLEERGTVYRAEGTVIAADDGVEVRLTDVLEGRAFATVGSLPFGTSLAERAIPLLGGAVEVTGAVRVLLPSRAVALVLNALGAMFDHASIEAGATFLGRAAKDAGSRPIVDTRLHLLDDGTVPGSLRTHAFDDRGATSVPLTLLREGRVDGHFIDTTTARRFDIAPTGHWFGSALRPNNLILRAGSRSVNVLLAESEPPVVRVDALTGTLHPETGEMRFRANGHVTVRGKVQGPIRDLPLAGDFLTVFNRVVEVASDTDRHGHIDAPAILVDGFRVGI